MNRTLFVRVFLFITLGVVNCALFFFMIWGQNGVLAYRDLKQQHAELQEQQAELEEKIVQLSHEIRLLKNDKNYQEKMIRQKLRYIRNNEIVYIFDAQN